MVPYVIPVQHLIQKLFWASDEGYEIASLLLPRRDISMVFEIG